MSYKQTFTDELISMGFRPHPDTVVFRLENLILAEDRPPKEIIVNLDGPVASPFDNVIFERESHMYIDTGHTRVNQMTLIRRVGEYSFQMAWVIKYKTISVNKSICAIPVGAVAYETDGGYFDVYENYKLAETPSETDFPDEFASLFGAADLLGHEIEGIPDDVSETVFWEHIGLLQKIMSSQKLELMHPTEGQTRDIQRRLGKNPSPYVTIDMRDGKTNGKATTSGNHTKRGLHRVRGHFRHVDSHPFIPSGVYFISPHLRGDSELGDRRRDYRVVLD